MVVCLGVAGLGGFGCKPSDTRASIESSQAESVREVQVALAARRNLERAVTVLGSFTAQEQATLSVKVAGRLSGIHVDLGSRVRAGSVLAEIERRDYELRVRQSEAALAQARARLGLPLDDGNDDIDVEEAGLVRQARAVLQEARANRDRVSRLFDDGVLSHSELDSASAAFTVATTRYEDAVEEVRQRIAVLAQRRVELDIARRQLEETRLLAPFDGVVQARLAGPGEFLNVGDPVVTLIQVDPLRLRLEITERDSPLIRTGQTVRATIEGDSTLRTGRVDRISPGIDPRLRMLVVEADIANDGSLHPGMFARASVVVNPTVPAITVPPEAVVSFAGVEKVFAFEDGRAVERNIVTGEHDTNWVEVISGLEESERVILSPGNLRNGEPVELVMPPPDPGMTLHSEPAPAAGNGS